ncbi:hypothetical protein ODV97_14800 [Enterococcus gallinarum]|nr:hypothetical protein [Enterococcus gallinarum]
MGRFVVIVLDSFGVGAMNDVQEVRPRDIGSTTAGHIIRDIPNIQIPTLEKLGLMNALGRKLDVIIFLKQQIMERVIWLTMVRILF